MKKNKEDVGNYSASVFSRSNLQSLDRVQVHHAVVLQAPAAVRYNGCI